MQYQLSNYHPEKVPDMDLIWIFNMPSYYPKIKPKYEHDKKNIFGLSKVFQNPWNSFRIVSSASMKYCSVRKEKTLLMYRSLQFQKTERDMTALGRFLNKKKLNFQVVWKVTFFREYCLLPEKQMRLHCGFMHTFEKKTFLLLQM